MKQPKVVVAYRTSDMPTSMFNRASLVVVTVEVEFRYGEHVEALAVLTEAFESVCAQIAEVAHDAVPNTNQAEV